MMSLWDALRMNMMISYQELVRTFPSTAFLLSFHREFYTSVKPSVIVNDDIAHLKTHITDCIHEHLLPV